MEIPVRMRQTRMRPVRWESLPDSNVRRDPLDRELANRRYIAGDRYSVADITGMIAVDFMKPAKLVVPDTMINLKRWYEDVSARPSAKA
jgi:glutathione S-transferase